MKRVEPYLEDVFETFPRASRRLCNAAEAVAIESHKPPMTRRFFYALLRWGWAIVPALLAVSVLTGCDSSAAASQSEAVQQDADALSSREWAGQQVCGAGMTAVWHGDVLECLRTRPVMAVEP